MCTASTKSLEAWAMGTANSVTFFLCLPGACKALYLTSIVFFSYSTCFDFPPCPFLSLPSLCSLIRRTACILLFLPLHKY